MNIITVVGYVQTTNKDRPMHKGVPTHLGLPQCVDLCELHRGRSTQSSFFFSKPTQPQVVKTYSNGVNMQISHPFFLYPANFRQCVFNNNFETAQHKKSKFSGAMLEEYGHFKVKKVYKMLKGQLGGDSMEKKTNVVK